MQIKTLHIYYRHILSCTYIYMVTTIQREYNQDSPFLLWDLEGSGTVYITIVPKWESLYIESEEYMNNETSFEWTWSEFLSHLDNMMTHEN